MIDKENTKIYCPYCKSERDTEMKAIYSSSQLAEWWYWETEFESCDAIININCSNCKKLLYAKEITIE